MNLSILMIDDSLLLHRLVASQCNSLGMAIHSAYDGGNGLTMAAQYRPSMILLDLDLPDIDGFEVCRRLKSDRETSRTPVIFLTADVTSGNKTKGLDLGAVDYITKPFRVEELLARVRSSLRTHWQMEQSAMIDGLTGLWNRAYLEDHLSSQVTQAAQSGQPLSCIVCDVDELRVINSRHGLTAGDEVLRSVGQFLLSQCRAQDAVCMCGAGKFSIVVSGMDRHAAGRLAERLCGQIQDLHVARLGMEIGVTCTFGVADVSVSGGASLFERADAALKRAKLNGKASVSVARPARQCLNAAA
jgi:two-component system, cell cycle response regulator